MGEQVRRRVLVTGGSRGIGRAVVERMAAAGDTVVATARSAASLEALGEEAAARGWQLQTAVCEVSDEAAVAALVEAAGPFEVVVANAGVAAAAPLERTSREDLDTQLAVNTVGVFTVLKATVPAMRERGFGRVVVVASTAGVTGAPYTSAYTASKHAAVGLVRATASELAGSGVTVNAVCPTYVDTDMTRETIQRIAERTRRSLDDAEAALLERVPLGRLVACEEVADAVAYLAGELAAPINGQTLILDGGGMLR